MASAMAHSRVGQGVLPISLSFRAARIVAANGIAYFRCSHQTLQFTTQFSTGNTGNNTSQTDMWHAIRCELYAPVSGQPETQ